MPSNEGYCYVNIPEEEAGVGTAVFAVSPALGRADDLRAERLGAIAMCGNGLQMIEDSRGCSAAVEQTGVDCGKRRD